MARKIAFIGLGEMGLGMAVNLVKSGFQVFGYDQKPSACKEAIEKGVIVCASIKEAANNSDNIVISIVRNLPQTEEVIFGANGILSNKRKLFTLIIMSTLDPNELNTLGKKTKDAGHVLIDAPVSGAKSRADEGTLTIMTAGSKDVIDNCRPFFDAMGKHIFYFGDKIGSAQAAKLSNNLMLAINMVGCTEGLKLSKSFDLPSDEFLELLKVSSGGSWVVQNWDAVSKWWEDYRPNETLDIVHKDIFAIQKICFEKKLSLPIGTLVSSQLLNSWSKLP